jgi:hypothetical protein
LVALAMLMGVIGSLAWASVAGGTPSSEKYDALIVRDEPVAWFRVGDPAGSSTIEDAVGAHTYTAANSGVVLGGNAAERGSTLRATVTVKGPLAAAGTRPAARATPGRECRGDQRARIHRTAQLSPTTRRHTRSHDARPRNTGRKGRTRTGRKAQRRSRSQR